MILALILLLAPGTAAAQGGETLPPGVTWDEVNSIAHQMYCDVCEGIPLDECESVACRDWRQEIATLLSQGRTEDEIIDYFVERYGTDVAAIPRDKADRQLAYAVPAVLVLLLGVIGGIQVWRLRKRGHHAGQVVRRTVDPSRVRPVPDDVDSLDLERLQQELEGLDP